MENDNLQYEYEVKPLPVLVPRGTRAWCGRFVQTVRHVGWRVIITFLIGAAIASSVLWWQSRTHAPAHEITPAATVTTAPPVPVLSSADADHDGGMSWPTFFEHLLTELAVAFLVSAIVIFAFEWGSEVKHSLDLAGNLASVLTTHINTVVKASAADAIANAMRDLAGSHAKGFSRQLLSFAASIQKLGDGGWAGHGYLEFMEWYHNEITGYAESLALLSEKVSTDPRSKAEFRLLLPEATVPIDAMLARLTKAMSSCGTYYAISDVFTWTKLTNFHAAQKQNLANGLKIRRIFVVGKPSDIDVPAKEVSTRLRNHYEDAERSKCGYRIRITSQADFERLAAPILNKTEHFGIFKPSDSEKHPIIVQVLEPQLLAFRIAGATEATAVLSAFKELWHELPPTHCENEEDPAIDDDDAGTNDGNDAQDGVPAAASGSPPAGSTSTGTNSNNITDRPTGSDMIRDHLMAYRMRQLPRTRRAAVWYHGASDIELWTKGALTEFEQAVVEAAEDGVEIKRLFIFEKQIVFHSKDPNKTFRTLKKHAEISQQKPNYQWRVILRSLMPPELRNEPFALFRDGKNVEVEVARGGSRSKFEFGALKAEATQLEEGFEEIWKQFRSSDGSEGEPLTAIRAFDDVPWKELPSGLRNHLKSYLHDAETKLRGELERSIETLFGQEATAIKQFITPSSSPGKNRTPADNEPEHYE